MKNSFIIKADICYSKNSKEIKTYKDSYLVCQDGYSKGVFKEIPDIYKSLEVYDYSGNLVLPGLIDLHVHAPQYKYRGLGLDLELLEWLDTYTFPEEAKYSDLNYAKDAYEKFVEDLRDSSTTRAAIFSTLHVESTILLMDMLEKSGLITYVGKVNMDRNGADNLEEKSFDESSENTLEWLKKIDGLYERTFPIITPRFIPSCSDKLMENLSKIRKEYNLAIQSHLSENQNEIAWVKELCPESKFYGDAYDRFGLFGGDYKAIMAHCVWSNDEERELLKKNKVFIAHCPNSNMNLSSGIAPVRKYLDEGQNIGLGSDVAGGIHLSIFKQISDAIQVSKLYWRLVDQTCKPLSIEEGFYLGSLGGGKFFGKVGSFEKDYEFDAIVLDQTAWSCENLNIRQKLERAIYMSCDKDVIHKFVRGRKIF
ncbi:MAG: amidohydrolase family protein [Peptoniphilaceae bacterium]|nr:amidohydrolase family protein [Peptoniphilaceae bacterium]